MLTGTQLGAALAVAMERKGVRQAAVAAEFGVQQPSVSEWLRFGRIGKRHLTHLVAWFSDVVGPEHWGLPSTWGGSTDSAGEMLPLREGEQDLLAGFRLLAKVDQQAVLAFVGEMVLAKHQPTIALMERLNVAKRSNDTRTKTNADSAKRAKAKAALNPK